MGEGEARPNFPAPLLPQGEKGLGDEGNFEKYAWAVGSL